MRQTWRSWFWNTVLTLVMIVMGGLAAQIAVTAAREGGWIKVAIFGPMAAICLWGLVRALLMSVSATPGGIVVRGFTQRTVIPWDEVVEITEPVKAPLVLSAPVVVRRREDGELQYVILSEVGGYGLSLRRVTPADRAHEGLEKALAEHRAGQSG